MTVQSVFGEPQLKYFGRMALGLFATTPYGKRLHATVDRRHLLFVFIQGEVFEMTPSISSL
jgi:hypothetical protein